MQNHTPSPIHLFALIVCTIASLSALPVLAVEALAGTALNKPAQNFAFNEFLVSKPSFVLPFYLFNGHILIDGAVNGKAGKFMFDTGTEFPFFLNNHYLHLPKEKFIAKGHTSSGQEMVLFRQHTPVNNIKLASQINFANVRNLLHTDWSFIEQAYTPFFLGSIGHGFNQNYLFLINYDEQTITFHGLNQDAGLLAKAVEPARVLTIFAFTPVGVDGKIPEVEVQLGDEPITAFFDTGSHGTLELTEDMKVTLVRKGLLSLSEQQYSYGSHEPHVSATLTGLRHGQIDLHGANKLTFKIGKINRLGLGYHFLKNYVSAWDYRQQTLTLIKPR